MTSTQARLATPELDAIGKYGLYQLKTTSLRDYLAKAPLENRATSSRLRLSIPLPDGTTTFAILGATTLSCQTLSPTQRRISFTPQYTEENGSSILLAITYAGIITTQPGPYALDLPTSEPLITLIAQQGSVTSSYNYRWLDACSAGTRKAADESQLSLQVLGNPVEGQWVELEIAGVTGNWVEVSLIDPEGRNRYQQQLDWSGQSTRVNLPLADRAGLQVVQVRTASQFQAAKVIKSR